MMGPEKLSDIRAKLREAFGKSDAELFGFFDRKIGELKPKEDEKVIRNLEMLRDALLRETKRKPRRRRKAAGSHER